MMHISTLTVQVLEKELKQILDCIPYSLFIVCAHGAFADYINDIMLLCFRIAVQEKQQWRLERLL